LAKVTEREASVQLPVIFRVPSAAKRKKAFDNPVQVEGLLIPSTLFRISQAVQPVNNYLQWMLSCQTWTLAKGPSEHEHLLSD
jgi:hypothetical protein